MLSNNSIDSQRIMAPQYGCIGRAPGPRLRKPAPPFSKEARQQRALKDLHSILRIYQPAP